MVELIKVGWGVKREWGERTVSKESDAGGSSGKEIGDGDEEAGGWLQGVENEMWF